MISLEGQVAIITGGAQGIGEGICKVFCDAGATVALWDVRDSGEETAAKIKADGGKIFFQKVDITDRDAVETAVSKIISTYKKIDILINNAALYAGLRGARFENLDEQQWDQVMQVNIKGTWLISRAVVDHMRGSGGGSIINIASLAAVFGLPYGLDYVASKAAVIGMTRGMARELGPDHIRVNAVAPSAVMTEGTEEFFGEKFEKAKSVIASNQLIPRNLETEDLTGTIVYLASDASRFVTGQTHMVDGGSWFL